MHQGQRGVRPVGLVEPVARRYRADGVPAELRETAAVHAAVEAPRAAVDQVDESGRDAAAVARHAEPVVRFFCSTCSGAVTGVRVNEGCVTPIASATVT